jgi:acetylornithine/succinyldiaminopimelate/putrescine aminotransferase
MVLKVAPPLIVTEEQLDNFVAAARSVVDLMHNSKVDPIVKTIFCPQ